MKNIPSQNPSNENFGADHKSTPKFERYEMDERDLFSCVSYLSYLSFLSLFCNGNHFGFAMIASF
jgi:hypothetical protein